MRAAFEVFCAMQIARIRRLADPYVVVQSSPRAPERLSHGTLYSYEHGCRCPFCRNANRARVERARVKPKGQCKRCAQSSVPGKSMCEAHLAQHASHVRTSYARAQIAQYRLARRLRRQEECR